MKLSIEPGKEKWKKAWNNNSFRYYFSITFVLFMGVIFVYGRFLDHIEERPGNILSDPILNLFSPIDVTWFTFGAIYISVILALFYLSQHPVNLLTALQAYILIAFARMASMYLTPLDPPPLLIPLEDPFVQSVSTGVLTKDLFFSGHTSTMFLLYLCCQNRKMKIIFLICTILVGLFVLVQHVHYSIDVLAAPFYAYSCYKISHFFTKKMSIEP